MPITKTDANGIVSYTTDPSGNEITQNEKWITGILLIVVTIFTMVAIIAHWPDKMPPHEGYNVSTKYQYKWFAITYLGKNGQSTDSAIFKINNVTFKIKDIVAEEGEPAADTTPKDESVEEVVDTNAVKADTVKKDAEKPDSTKKEAAVAECKKKRTCEIDLSTLILLLVALSGFLGNMIHIAASFTNFIGAGKFKRSWMLWYFVKPFTAAALAVGVYIIFRAGFLNSTEATASVNLYGVVAIAVLAGLYTDMATQKLKEVFAVVFQSSTVRPNPLELPPIKITSANPTALPLNVATEIVLSGSGFENRVLKFKIDGEEITGVTVQPNSVVFTYTATKAKPQLSICDEKGTEITKYEFITAEADVTTPQVAAVTVTDISPTGFAINTATDITITGTGLDTATLTIKVAGTDIAATDITKTATTMVFKYTAVAAGDIIVSVQDDKGTELLSKTLTVA